MWLTEQERLTLAVLGFLMLIGLGILLWQSQRPPITAEVGPPPPYAQWEAAVTQARQVDLNHATASELERLPEIGPSLAKRIVAYRDAHGAFRRPEELLEVPGIGPSTFDALQEYVTVK